MGTDDVRPGLDPVEEAELFRTIASSSPSGIVASGPGGAVVWANAAAAAIFGWDVDELIGQNFTVLLPEEVRERVAARRERIVAGDTDSFVTTGLRRDGTRIDIHVTPGVRLGDDGRVLGVSVIVSDVTEQLRVERELTDALARSRARFDQAVNPQALVDLQGRFVDVNDAACRLFGRDRRALVGRDSAALVLPADPERVREQLRLLTQGVLESATYETVGLRSDGDEVPLLIDVTVVRDDDGRPTELACLARDLTEVRAAQRGLLSQDAFFRALYQRSSDAAVVVDQDGHLTYVSPAFTRVLGYGAEEALSLWGFDLVHPDDVPVAEQGLRAALGEPGGSARLRVRVRDAQRAWRWFEVRVTNCLDEPDIAGVVANLREVTGEVEAARALRESEARYRAIAETAQEGIIAFDLDGTVLFANEKMSEIVGIPQAELYRSGFLDALDPGETEKARQRLRVRSSVGAERYDVPYRHPDGGDRVLSVSASPLRNDDGATLGALGMVSDITEARQAEAALRHQALHDALTGLPNRHLLVDRLAMAAARQERRSGHGIAVLFLDLDHFKLVNDGHGHAAGDRVLAEVAARLQQAVRETDTVARLGGDEFAVVCEDTDADGAGEVAGRIQQALKEPFTIAGEHVYIGVSIGVALSPPYSSSDLLRFADAAMYGAKSAGSSQVSTFDGSDGPGGQRRLALEAALRTALDEESLTLGYQPIVDFGSRRMVGLEALLRWQPGDLGEVSAAEIVTAAETAGLSFELDRAVILAAGRDLVRLREAGVVADDVAVSVNVSPRTAQQQRLVDAVREMLAATGLPASCLALDITEHAIMDNVDQAAALLGRLVDGGVAVAIDDFGTGYNSLAQLQRLPVDVLKIDRTFVQDLTHRPQSLAVARSIVSLAQAIGMRTVAEGVETEEQAQLLRQAGCDAGQGYLWGPALPVDELPAAIARWTG